MRLQCRPAAREQHTVPLCCVVPQLSATQKPPSLAHLGNQPGSCIRPAGTRSSKQAAPTLGTCYLQGLELQEGNWKPELKKEVAWSHLNSPLPNPQVNPRLDLDTHTLALLFPSSNSMFAARSTAVAKAGKECCVKQS